MEYIIALDSAPFTEAENNRNHQINREKIKESNTTNASCLTFVEKNMYSIELDESEFRKEVIHDIPQMTERKSKRIAAISQSCCCLPIRTYVRNRFQNYRTLIAVAHGSDTIAFP